MPQRSDTDAESLEMMTALYRQMSPEEKIERVRDLTLAASRLALAGLRARHPMEAESNLLLRLARIRLGVRIVDEAYHGTDEPHDA